ncbi:MAG: flavodoxin-dependent (E)-4-hydroxy-3-methylbut-2-enyl-diphosphate synthase, partial [Anaerovoracaceae bacterium]
MKKRVRCGRIEIGGTAPISIQSMLNVDTRDIKAAVGQIQRLEEVGCQIVRLAIPDEEAAAAFGEIKKQVGLPLVADIHFDYRLALAAIKNGADKVRINPGNIGSRQRVEAVVHAAKERNIPIRVGVNSGSLEKDLLQKYGGPTAEALAQSALRNVRILEDLNFEDIVISLKSSDVRMNDQAYR